jgi:F-type H+-transporting ATPase subunit a
MLESIAGNRGGAWDAGRDPFRLRASRAAAAGVACGVLRRESIMASSSVRTCAGTYGEPSLRDRLPAGSRSRVRLPVAIGGLLILLFVCGPVRSVAAASGTLVPQAHETSGAAADHGADAAESHGLSQKALDIARPFGFPINNSMVVTWIVALGLIVLARLATRRMTDVPGGVQNFFEWLVENLYEFLESIIGPHLVKRTFWFFATIFIFILAANWIGLLPGVGTIGWGHATGHGFKVEEPLFRGANADLNLTLAMSLVFFACWIVWAVQEVGVGGITHELFAPKGEMTGALRILMIAVFFAAGLLEIVSILFRPVSLSFRLYGNIFAGENMLEAMATMVPGLGWLLPIPFYFMELLVGLVQAMVFMLLTAVFTLLICQHESHSEAGGTAAHA